MLLLLFDDKGGILVLFANRGQPARLPWMKVLITPFYFLWKLVILWKSAGPIPKTD
jgi:hypothetical protein